MEKNKGKNEEKRNEVGWRKGLILDGLRVKH